MSLSSNVSGVSNVGVGYSSLLNNRANNNVGIGNSHLVQMFLVKKMLLLELQAYL